MGFRFGARGRRRLGRKACEGGRGSAQSSHRADVEVWRTPVYSSCGPMAAARPKSTMRSARGWWVIEVSWQQRRRRRRRPRRGMELR